MLWIVGGGVLVGLVLFVIFAPPGAQLWLARKPGAATLFSGSVHAARGGLVVHEIFSLSRGGEVGKITYVPADAHIRSTLMSRGYSVLGVTETLIWTSAPGRPSFVIPSLEEGPKQAEVLARCGVDAFEVTVPEGTHRLRVTTRDGRTVYCNVDGEISSQPPESGVLADTSNFTLVRRDARFALLRSGVVVAEGLLDARFPDFVPSGEGGGDLDTVYVVHRRQLGSNVPLTLSRFGPDAEQWSIELGAERCGIVDAPRLASAEGRLLVVGTGRSCSSAMALEPRSGRVLWSRVLSSY